MTTTAVRPRWLQLAGSLRVLLVRLGIGRTFFLHGRRIGVGIIKAACSQNREMGKHSPKQKYCPGHN